MIKKIAAAVLSAITMLLFCSCSLTEYEQEEKTNRCSVPPKMLFLGDSIAAGYGLEGYTDTDNYNCRSYSNILNDRYAYELKDKCPQKMVNEAVSGSESADLLETLRSGSLTPQLHEADAVVISIGGNDMLHILLGLFADLGISPETHSFNYDDFHLFQAVNDLYTMSDSIDAALEQYAVNLVDIADYISSVSDGKIYIQTLYDPFEGFFFDQLAALSAEKIGKLNSIIRDNAAGNYEVIELAPLFQGKAEMLTNISQYDIHPNADGHAVIADAVDDAFRDTGFSYSSVENGRKILTPAGYAAIGACIAALVLCIVLSLIVLTSKKHKTSDGE
ncbi:MAG: SGNH/GDSL hydrolase family protein [Ruminococcus sp.]|nr:SGNH/GDSL hydrolase family protein [Ruminococcus sp.]